jgi:hypothetical protein
VARSLYTSGLTDFVNVLEAERSLYEAQDALTQSERNISTDVVALYKSLGGGWDAVEKTPSLGVIKLNCPLLRQNNAFQICGVEYLKIGIL